MNKLTIDFETRSRVDLPTVGAYIYSQHESTQVMCLGWSYGQVEGQWRMGDEPPDLLFAAMRQFGMGEAHNAFFEASIWTNVCVKRMGWPEPPPNFWRCSAAKAAAASLPRDLASGGRVLGLSIVKDEDGKKSMMKLSKPAKATKAHPDRQWHEDEADWHTMLAYNMTDVMAEKALSEALPDLSAKEQRVWEMSERMNRRGFAVDTYGAQSAVLLATEYVNKLNEELHFITDGAVNTAGQRAKILAWLQDGGVPIEDTTAPTIDAQLQKHNSKSAQRVMEIVRTAGRISTKKYQKMLDMAAPDSRIRGLFLYHGAGPGRWAGRDLQPHNFPRGKIKDQEWAWALINERNLEMLEMLVDPMEFLSHALRGAIWAPAGRRLLCGDYNAIETRVLFWLADEQIGLNVFRDATKEIYCDMASRIYRRHITKKQPAERQFGKQAILGLGFGMGFVKFLVTCRGYNIRFTKEQVVQLVPTATRVQLEAWIWQEAWSRVKQMIPDATREDLHELVLMKYVTDQYRSTYRRVVKLWDFCQRAAILAIQNPGKAYKAGTHILFYVKGKFLHCQLPSGRSIKYPFPRYDGHDITYMGVDSHTHQWVRMKTYGGALAQGATQGTARDFMVEGMLRCEDTIDYFELILTVHDEVGVETDLNEGSLQEFLELLEQPPEWAPDLPMKAEGFEGRRYRKA